MSSLQYFPLCIYLVFLFFEKIKSRPKASLHLASTEFVNVVNCYIKASDREIILSPHNKLIFDKIRIHFLSDKPMINEEMESIDYYNAHITIMYNIKLENKHFDPSITRKVVIEKRLLASEIVLQRLELLLKFDNSFDYFNYYDPIIKILDLGTLKEFQLFNFLFEEFGEKQFSNLLVSIWEETIKGVLTIYPMSDAFNNYRLTVKYLQASQYFSCSYKEDPSLTKIKFKSFRYDSMERIEPYSRLFNNLYIDIDYERDHSYGTTIHFDKIIFSIYDITFGTMSPTLDYIELAVKDLLLKGLAYIREK